MDRRRRHRLLALPLVAWGLFGPGCGTIPHARPTGGPPDVASIIQTVGAPSSQRAQKPEPRPNPLNITEPSGGSRGARILAVVNDIAIMEEEVQAAAYSRLIGTRTEAEKAEILKAQLDEIIDRELVIQDAETKLGNRGGGRFLDELRKAASQEFEKQWLHKLMKANGYTDENKFKVFLRENGMSVELIRRQWERNFIAMEYARGRLETSISRVSQREVSEYYERHPEEFKVEASLEWQDLFILASRHPTREAALQFAKSLVARARRGEDFAKLAKEFDNGDSSLRPNAEGIGKRKGEIKPPEAEPVVLSLREGEIGEPVEIETGFHIVKVVKKTVEGRTPFDAKVQKAIRDKLRGDAFMKERNRFLATLRRFAVIQRADLGQ